MNSTLDVLRRLGMFAAIVVFIRPALAQCSPLPGATSSVSICDGPTVVSGSFNVYLLGLAPQYLRGERVRVTTSQPGVCFDLYTPVGQRLATGSTIDVRVPVRGSYLLHVTAPPGVTFPINVLGGRCQTNSSDVPDTFDPGVANVGAPAVEVMDPQWTALPFETSARYTIGEDLVMVGDRPTAVGFDYADNRSFIVQYDAQGNRLWRVQTDNDDYLRTLAAGADGSIYAVGVGGQPGPADQLVVRKFSPQGLPLWRWSYSTSGYDYAFGVEVTPTGEVYVAGSTSGVLPIPGAVNPSGLDLFVLKLRADGSVPLWQRQLNTLGDTRAFSCKTDSTGALYVFGDTDADLSDPAVPQGAKDLCVLRFTPDGLPVWTRQFGSSENDLAFMADFDRQDRLYLTGMTRGRLDPLAFNPNPPDVYVAQISTSGQVNWIKQLGASAGQSAESIVADDTGAYVLFYTNGGFPPNVNNSSDVTNASDDMVVAAYDSAGNRRWVQQFPLTTERIFARGIAVDGRSIYTLRDHVDGALTPSTPPYAFATVDGFTVCNLADITGIGGGAPDGQLTVDDVIEFVNLFSDGTGCPGASPCNVADVVSIGGGLPADRQLTVDDVIGFVNAFSDGCP